MSVAINQDLNSKYEIRNSKQIQNNEIQNKKQYNLEDRTLAFAKNVRNLIKQIPRTIASIEDSKQLVRSSGSVGANYIEANESLSKKDLAMRVKISRKEAKESKFWLELLEVPDTLEVERRSLLKEAGELMNILSAILIKLT